MSSASRTVHVRFLFRFAALVVIAVSFLFVVYDGTKSIADQTIYISRVGPTWVNIYRSSLSAFESVVEAGPGEKIILGPIRRYVSCTPNDPWLALCVRAPISQRASSNPACSHLRSPAVRLQLDSQDRARSCRPPTVHRTHIFLLKRVAIPTSRRRPSSPMRNSETPQGDLV
jgi:hypothetical protein